ncbi:MAG TPA: ABC transporter substrate-binding protein [Terriglobales bacterium]|nr:ABC transporter substrate-binding protein [Terriglobales bacterium]
MGEAFRNGCRVQARASSMRAIKLSGVVIVLLAVAVIVVPRAGEAQPVRVPRIGYLAYNSLPPLLEAFHQGLRDLGYVEGQNISIEYRLADERSERLGPFAAELVGLKVDVIVAPTPIELKVARRATTTIPIIMIAVGNPVTNGYVRSFSHPGGNITGLSSLAQEISSKQVELLKEVIPTLSRLALLQNPDNQNLAADFTEAARKAKIKLQLVEARAPTDLDTAFSAMMRERAGGLVVAPDPMFYAHRTRIAELAAMSRLPALYQLREHADAGGLIAYGASRAALWRRAAVYVDKLIKGAKPADLPVEQPTKFELVINVKTAKALGLTIPPAVLLRADEVIQ